MYCWRTDLFWGVLPGVCLRHRRPDREGAVEPLQKAFWFLVFIDWPKPCKRQFPFQLARQLYMHLKHVWIPIWPVQCPITLAWLPTASEVICAGGNTDISLWVTSGCSLPFQEWVGVWPGNSSPLVCSQVRNAQEWWFLFVPHPLATGLGLFCS